MRISVKDLVGPDAVTYDDGARVHIALHAALSNHSPVVLDFNGVQVFASPFFNSSVGRLLSDFEADELNALLTIEHLSESGEVVLRRAIENAKDYFSDASLRNAVAQVVGDRSAAQ
jgi:hypothetical protein